MSHADLSSGLKISVAHQRDRRTQDQSSIARIFSLNPAIIRVKACRIDREHTLKFCTQCQQAMATNSNDSHSHAVEMLAPDYRLLTRIQEQTLKMKLRTQEKPIHCTFHLQMAFSTTGYWDFKKKFLGT